MTNDDFKQNQETQDNSNNNQEELEQQQTSETEQSNENTQTAPEHPENTQEPESSQAPETSVKSDEQQPEKETSPSSETSDEETQQHEQESKEEDKTEAEPASMEKDTQEEEKTEVTKSEEPSSEQETQEESKEESKTEEKTEEVKTETSQAQPESKEEPKSETGEEAKSGEKAEQAETEAKTEEETKAEEKDKAAEERRQHLEKVFEELKPLKENNEPIEVKVVSRIRGGLRTRYNGMQMFLPASHFSLRRNPLEKNLQDAVGSTLKVLIHELEEDEQGRKTVIVSRKKILEDEFWTNINVGDKVEGTVSSIANFGVFVDIGGIEGLIHISRLSQVHVDDPKDFVKKGDKIEAVVVDADRERNRIALSKKELEESPWKDVHDEFPVGSQLKGIVRRLTDFGAYVELKPGVDGLLRTNEISWTKRLKKPSDVLNPGDEIDVEVIALSTEKQNITLSHKRTKPNPWDELKEKYPVNTELSGTVMQVVPQGCIISIDEELDGFMPRSKIKPIMEGKKIPFSPGDNLDVVVADIVPEDESLILAPKIDEELQQQRHEKPRKSGKKEKQSESAKGDTAFTLGDMLSDQDMNKLKDKMND